MTGRVFDDTERAACVVRTIVALRNEPRLIVKCFQSAGLLPGYPHVASHFPPRVFNHGMKVRDICLTQVNCGYIQSGLSIFNLSSHRGASATIPESLISEQQRTTAAYMACAAGFRSFYFALRLSANIEDKSDGEGSESPENVNRKSESFLSLNAISMHLGVFRNVLLQRMAHWPEPSYSIHVQLPLKRKHEKIWL